jgi:hypothetical protein
MLVEVTRDKRRTWMRKYIKIDDDEKTGGHIII